MLKINEKRFLDDMEAQAKIGDTGDGGVSRPALSPADIEVRLWFQNRVESDGIEFIADGAGNLSARLPSDNPDAKTLLIGSHLDSVKNGGRFDGALGVLSALETLRTIRDAGQKLPFHLEAISFTDEEGSILGMMGSSALAGTLTLEELQNPRGGRTALVEGMNFLEISDETALAAKRDRSTLLGYFELHIEQGTRLEESNTDIGVVTSLVGVYSYWLRFLGKAAHAGTMPMEKRRDALWGASDFVQRAKTTIMEQFTPGVVNFGRLHIQPGAFNIVPAEVDLAMEFRHGDAEQLHDMQGELLHLALHAAQDNDLILDVNQLEDVAPGVMDEQFISALESAADQLNLSHKRMMSFALHDAQTMSRIVPSAMFFVPSVNGISHNPKEFTKPEDCINGANVLLNAVLYLAETMG